MSVVQDTSDAKAHTFNGRALRRAAPPVRRALRREVVMPARRVLFFISVVVVLLAAEWISQRAGQSELIVKHGDNVCGLHEARQLSNPARVDDPRLMAATPEGQRMEREGLDPEFTTGGSLLAEARAR